MSSSEASSESSSFSMWQLYNGEDSFLPLYFPLAIWTSAYVYSKHKGFDFSKWSFLHNFHNVGCILLGITSILINDDTIFNERVVILWSIGYFGVDILDCALRKDGVYLLHGAFCFLLGLVNYTTPLCRQLRTNSKATLCEISNPIMHLAKKTRNPIHFAAFALVYTLCRIVWIPIIMHQMHQLGMPWTDVRILGVASFYGLNLFWYYKILKILVDGLLAGDEKPKKE